MLETLDYLNTLKRWYTTLEGARDLPVKIDYLQIAELDATYATETTRPVLRKTYLWDPAEPIATRILVMSLFDEQGVYKEDLYYTHDALKNTTALFGIKAGRRTLYEYGPYGSIVRQEGDAAEENPFRYSSEYLDEETGLIAFTYRYYNPVDGRWIMRDSIGEQSGYKVDGIGQSTVGSSLDLRRPDAASVFSAHLMQAMQEFAKI